MTATIMKTKNGEAHGLINTLANSVKDNGFQYFSPENKVKAEKLKKDESRLVRAKYRNNRGSNERLTKPYCRWAGDPIKVFRKSVV